MMWSCSVDKDGDDRGDARGVTPPEFDPFDGSFDEKDSLLGTYMVMVEILPRACVDDEASFPGSVRRE